MVHERKLCSTHQLFADYVKSNLPAVSNSNFVLVTDNEPSFDVFDTTLPKLNRGLCWNHVLTDVKQWVLKRNGTNNDVVVYVSHAKQLLHCSNEATYKVEREIE
jgi:hypothetical protein